MEIILLIILIIAGLGAHFISAAVKKSLADQGKTIAIAFSVISFFISLATIGFMSFYGWLALGLMCGEM